MPRTVKVRSSGTVNRYVHAVVEAYREGGRGSSNALSPILGGRRASSSMSPSSGGSSPARSRSRRTPVRPDWGRSSSFRPCSISWARGVDGLGRAVPFADEAWCSSPAPAHRPGQWAGLAGWLGSDCPRYKVDLHPHGTSMPGGSAYPSPPARRLVHPGRVGSTQSRPDRSGICRLASLFQPQARSGALRHHQCPLGGPARFR